MIENIDVFLLYIVRQLIRERLFDIYSTINMFDLLNLKGRWQMKIHIIYFEVYVYDARNKQRKYY